MTTTAGLTKRAWLGSAAAIAAALMLLIGATAAFGAEFEGPVLSKDKQARTFRMNPENHANVTIKVNDGTKFQRLDGFGDIHRGLKVEVTAARHNGDWVASKVEKRRASSGPGRA
jgi:Domain of unknown function (DUF5666)